MDVHGAKDRMYKILIVEDDKVIGNAIGDHIKTWGYQVSMVSDFKNVIADFVELSPHLVLMDISLPFFNGYHWCSEIRKVSKVPIIFISSAADNMNVVMAVNMGGDDFIAKPFDLEILTVKVQAMLRRTYDFGGKNDLLQHKGAVLNLSDTSLHYDEKKLELPRNDYIILKTLMEHKEQTVSRDTLMTRLWEGDHYVDENTLTVNITRLRRKLSDIGLEDFITTKKGIGYMVE
jgi:DNA-binding response OmpR family regulator